MADFRRQKRYTTREPLLKVDGGLPAGTYVFELQVEDESGNLSTWDRLKVTVVDGRIPVSPIDIDDLRIDRPVLRDHIIRWP